MRTSTLTKDELDFILENYKNGNTFCCEHLKRSAGFITKIFKEYNLVLTKEEKWLVASKGRRYTNEQAGVKVEQFLNITSPEVAYFLGYFWADGCARDIGWCFSFCIAEEDYNNIKEGIIDKIGKWSIYQRKAKSKKHKNAISMRSYNSEVKEWLLSTDHHIKSKVSAQKILDKIPNYLKHYWWRGLVDGDGCINDESYGYGISIASSYDYDWSFVIELFNSLDITKYNIQKCINELGKSSSIVLTARDNVFKFCKYIYQNREIDKIGLDRKYNKYLWLLQRAEDNKYENRTEELRLAAIKANFCPDRKRQYEVRGIKKNGAGWACMVGNKYVGNYSDKNAAINAYNYFGREIYGDLFFPNPVEVFMDKDAFLRFLKIKKKYSKYKWISFIKRSQRWQAFLRPRGGVFKEIGNFGTEKEALDAYNQYIKDNSLVEYPVQQWTGPSNPDGEKFEPFGNSKNSRDEIK